MSDKTIQASVSKHFLILPQATKSRSGFNAPRLYVLPLLLFFFGAHYCIFLACCSVHACMIRNTSRVFLQFLPRYRLLSADSSHPRYASLQSSLCGGWLLRSHSLTLALLHTVLPFLSFWGYFPPIKGGNKP